MSDKWTELCATCSDRIEDLENDLCEKCQRNLIISLEGNMSDKKWTPEPPYKSVYSAGVYEIRKIEKHAEKAIGIFYDEAVAEYTTECVNALAGLNPEAVRELIEAAKWIAKYDRTPPEDYEPMFKRLVKAAKSLEE